MKKIVIVGANSYIARNLIYILKQKGFNDNIALYDFTEKHIDGEKNYQKIEILEQKSVSQIDMDCDVIFMFVGKTGSTNGFDSYNTFIDINERALLNLLNEYCRQNSKAKIVFPSTRLVYKGKKEVLNEESEKEFKTIYSMNKYACEQYLKQYNNVYGVQYLIFRICVPYGTFIPDALSYGTTEFMLNKAIKGENISLYGDGSARRTLTYIGDLCETLITGAFSELCCNDVFNIGGENYSLKEMAELIAKKYSVGIDYIPYPEISLKVESGDTIFDDTKLKSIIGNTTASRFIDWIDKK